MSYWKDRRLAKRGPKVLERHAPTSASLALFLEILGPVAESYVMAYDAWVAYRPTVIRENQEGRDSVAAALKIMEQWKPHVARVLPGFDLTTIGDHPAVPEDVCEDADRLADAIDTARQPDGTPYAWAADAVGALHAASSTAERESDEAAAANSHYAALTSTVQTTNAAFRAEMARVRRGLAAAIGRHHPDYQKLRESRAGTVDVDDDPAAPPPSPPVVPTGTGTP